MTKLLAVVDGFRAAFVDCTRRDIDKKALQADHAELYAAYLKETHYKRFAVA